MEPTTSLLRSRPDPQLLSICIPFLNEAAAIPHLRERLAAFRATLAVPVELVLVDDGSRDETLALLLSWAEADASVKVVGLARNFGHQAAVTAGLDHATGDAVVIMDADLQDPPEVIPDLLAAYRRGYDVAVGQRSDREGDTVFKRATAWAFYRLMRGFIQKDLPADAGDFRLISRPCLDAVRSMRETHRFLRGMMAWVGFPQTLVPYRRQARVAGETKYPLWKMLRFALTAALSFSPAPLRISYAMGFVTTMLGLAYGLYAFARWSMGLYVVKGWTSLIVLLCLIGGGLQMSLGILGEYVARIFEEAKGRPLYVVARAANLGAPLAVTPPPAPSALGRRLPGPKGTE